MQNEVGGESREDGLQDYFQLWIYDARIVWSLGEGQIAESCECQTEDLGFFPANQEEPLNFVEEGSVMEDYLRRFISFLRVPVVSQTIRLSCSSQTPLPWKLCPFHSPEAIWGVSSRAGDRDQALLCGYLPQLWNRFPAQGTLNPNLFLGHWCCYRIARSLGETPS